VPVLHSQIAEGAHHRLHFGGCFFLAFLDSSFYCVFNPALELTDIFQVYVLGVDMNLLDFLFAGYLNLDAPSPASTVMI